MHLTCPNCDARYEVPESAIPEGGREVQCSNCGHSWLQTREALAADEAAMPGDTTVSPPDAARAADVAPPATTGAPAHDKDETLPEQTAPPEEEADAPTTTLDDRVRAILREEAELESALRQAEVNETADVPPAPSALPAVAENPGPAAPAPIPAPDPVAGSPPDAPTARLRKGARTPQPPAPMPAASPVIAAPATAAAATGTAPRRDLFPDVEEITSTLRPASATADNETAGHTPPAAPARGAFRSGFLLALALLFLGSVIYITAGELAQRVPALSGVLGAYVSIIDSLREWLRDLTERATEAMAAD